MSKRVGTRVRHADAPARVLDDASFGQRLDERDLLLCCPAIMAGAQNYGRKLDFWFAVIVSHEPIWNIDLASRKGKSWVRIIESFRTELVGSSIRLSDDLVRIGCFGERT